MSDLKVEVTRVKSVANHPNADRLDLVECDGYNCIVSRDRFKVGDTCIYLPVDSVMPPALLARIFGPDAKVHPSGGRIKIIRLRGVVSQGLVLAPDEVADLLPNKYKQGADVTEALGITKYTKRVKGPSSTVSAKGKKKRSRRILHEQFRRYTDIQNVQKHGWMLEQLAKDQPDVPFVYTEKLHGTSARYGWLQRKGLLERIRAFFGAAPRFVFLMGSRNVDMYPGSNGPVHNSLPRNVYEQIAKKYDMKSRIPNGYTVYGEIIGHGVQPGYAYGHRPGDVDFAVYDVQKDGEWLSDAALDDFCKTTALRRVPCILRGEFSMEKLKELASGPSCWPGAQSVQPVREGIVVRPAAEARVHGTRAVFKFVSADFLLGKHADEEIEDTATSEEELTVVSTTV